ncbi:MAG: tetratricopeptide repeat protein [Lacunisphaera sp.]
MNEPADRPAWKEELDAIVGARAYGQSAEIMPRLEQLDRRHPNIPEINYQLAWTCDVLGRSAEALPYYEKAVALGLAPNELSGALIGLGATLRALGQLDRSADVLTSGRAQFPENRELEAFLALTRHAQGRHGDSLRLLIDTLCDTTEDPGLRAYQRAIRHAASNL